MSAKGQQGRKLQLSVPPGIENLGATCYLNTQLQCLTQNRVFVQGIMSCRGEPPKVVVVVVALMIA